MRVGAHCASRILGKRQYQQDDYGIFELPANLKSGDLLLVLADGMGASEQGIAPAQLRYTALLMLMPPFRRPASLNGYAVHWTTPTAN